MICDHCQQDRPSRQVLLLAYFRAGWPPIELRYACRYCRGRIPRSRLRRAAAYGCYLTLFAAVGAAAFGVVQLVRWIARRFFTS